MLFEFLVDPLQFLQRRGELRLGGLGAGYVGYARQQVGDFLGLGIPLELKALVLRLPARAGRDKGDEASHEEEKWEAHGDSVSPAVPTVKEWVSLPSTPAASHSSSASLRR